MVEVKKIMVASFKRSHVCTATFSAPNNAAGHHQPTPPPETTGHSQASLSQSPWAHCSLPPGPGAHKVLSVPSKSLFPRIEFQRIARRDKKAFLSDQCKEIEGNNRMGKIRDLFKKIRDTKGTFHAKTGLIKDKNGMDLTEAVDIKKRWQEYTEELYKKDLHNPDDHNCVITHLEPDSLECKVNWALGNITTNKASRGDGIPAELFQILRDNTVKVLHSICQQIWKTQQWPQGWKSQFSFQSQRKAMPKNAQTTA